MRRLLQSLPSLRRRYTRPIVSVACTTKPPLVSGVREVTESGDGRFALQLEPDADAAAVLRALIDSGAEIAAFEPELASMEEIFIEVVAAEEIPR